MLLLLELRCCEGLFLVETKIVFRLLSLTFE